MYYCKECKKVHNTFIGHVKNLIEKYEKIKIKNPYKDIIVAKIKYTLDEELNKHYLIDKSSITNENNIIR